MTLNRLNNRWGGYNLNSSILQRFEAGDVAWLQG